MYHILDTALVLNEKLKSNIKADVKRHFLIRTSTYPTKGEYSLRVKFSNESDYLNDGIYTDSLHQIYGILNYKGVQFLVMDNAAGKERVVETIFKVENTFSDYIYRKYYRYNKRMKANVETTYNDARAYLYFKISEKNDHTKYEFIDYITYPF